MWDTLTEFLRASYTIGFVISLYYFIGYRLGDTFVCIRENTEIRHRLCLFVLSLVSGFVLSVLWFISIPAILYNKYAKELK